MKRKEELIKKLKEIEAEANVADKEKFEKIVQFLDNGDLFLKFIDHSRTSCSDDKIANDHTTPGRGGAFRCNRCGLITALETWKRNRDWLIDCGSGNEIENYLQFIFDGIDLHIKTFAE